MSRELTTPPEPPSIDMQWMLYCAILPYHLCYMALSYMLHFLSCMLHFLAVYATLRNITMSFMIHENNALSCMQYCLLMHDVLIALSCMQYCLLMHVLIALSCMHYCLLMYDVLIALSCMQYCLLMHDVLHCGMMHSILHCHARDLLRIASSHDL